jgi:adenosylcobinamide-GDP ribazoletransferase
VIREELRLFWVAVMFLTRVPAPQWVGHRPEDAARSTLYFPVVGLLLGGLGASTYALARCGYGPSVAALCGMAAIATVTGAFHEDAFADVCDGFGGWTPERRLEIMRDSRLGAYGVVGLILLIGLKALLLASMNFRQALSAFIVAHTVARWTSLLLLTRFPAVPNTKSLARPLAGAIPPARFALASALTLAVCILIGLITARPLTACLTPFLVIGLCLSAGRFFVHWLGGLSGDCLGAVNQLAELLCYFVLASR